MTEVDRAEQRVAELRALLRDFRHARADVPSLARPARAVGARGTWTGRVPDRLHREELAPMAGGMDRALARAEQAIVDELADAVRSRDRAVADARAAEAAAAREAEGMR